MLDIASTVCVQMSHFERQLSLISDPLINVIVASVPPDYEISHVESGVKSKGHALDVIDGRHTILRVHDPDYP